MAKLLTGIVKSKKSDKTIVVIVTSRHTHPIYKKQYSVSRNFMAHDPENEAKEGDKVMLREIRPMSAQKRWQLAKVVERARISHQEPVGPEEEAK